MRGRVTVGKRVVSLPWRLANIQDLPSRRRAERRRREAQLGWHSGDNGEFDTPIDPRFPTFLATNLSEALPGPFSPASASATVRGLRASAVCVAERLRPGGMIQREIAMRMVAVFAHRLYGAITTAHFMAETVPFVKPTTVVSNSGFFGPSMAALPIFGEERPSSDTGRVRKRLRTVRNIGVFGVNLIGLSAGAPLDTREFVADVDRLERLTDGDLTRLDDRRLLSLISLARDEVVHGWVLAAGSFLLCAAFNVLLRGLCGRDTAAPGGTGTGQRALGRGDAAIGGCRTTRSDSDGAAGRTGGPTGQAGRRGPGIPCRAAGRAVADRTSWSGRARDAVDQLRRRPRVAGPDGDQSDERAARTAAAAPSDPAARQAYCALWPTQQLRDREVRRDKVVRANWVLRNLLREYGRRLVEAGVFDTADDVFYLLVDELDALPADARALVARRRAEQRRLAAVAPPTVFSGTWQPTATSSAALASGDTLRGVGVCGGRVRGRVRIVRPETIDDLQPGEILVAEVTDVGYTAAFCYAAAVVTELGGPMSHAAVVAREFGFPCVVDVQGATKSLPPGALVEVDGTTGEIHVLELAAKGALPS